MPIVLGVAAVAAIGLAVVWIIQTAEQDGEGGPGMAPSGPPPATVIVAPVRMRAAQEQYSVTGDLRAVSRAQVAAREAGAVDSIPVNEGDAVTMGDVLVKLDHRRLDAARAEAQAQIAAAKSLVVQREADRNRMVKDLEMKQPLLAKRAISERELLDAEQAAAVAEAAHLVAKETLIEATSRMDLLDIRYRDLDIVAPFDGRIIQRHVEPGEWLVPGQAVMTLVSTGTIEAWLQVPERYAADVSAHLDEIEVFVTALYQSVPSQSVKVVADIDKATRMFAVVVTLDGSDSRLAPGMSVRARIPVGTDAPRLMVPVDALVHSRMGDAVFTVGPAPPDGGMPAAVRVPVQVLFDANGHTFVDSEQLKEGDMVVVEGNQRLFPNTPLIANPLQQAGDEKE